MVVPCSWLIWKKRSWIDPLVVLSRLPVGSSAKQQLGTEHQRARDGDPLLLAARQLAGTVRRARREADLVEERGGLLFHLLLAATLDQPREHQVLEGVELGQKVVKLKHEADLAVANRGQPGAAHGGQLLARQTDAPTGGQIEGAHAVQQGALAGARGLRRWP